MENILYYSLENRLFLLVTASYIAVTLGLSATLTHFLLLDTPAQGWRSFLHTLELRLNRPHRHVRDRIMRGRLTLLILCGITSAIALTLLLLTSLTSFGWYIELATLAYLLPISRVILPVRQGLAIVKTKRFKELPALIQPLTDADCYDADGHQLLRILVTYTANALARYVIAPAFWYILLGLPALMLCRLLSCLCDMFPTTIKKNRSFVTAFHFWDKAMQLVPMRFSLVILWIGLLFVPKVHPLLAFRAFSPRAAEPPITTRTLATRLCAYAMKFSLAGPYVVDGHKRPDLWIGAGKARLDGTDLSRVLWWYWCSASIWLATLTAFYLMLLQ